MLPPSQNAKLTISANPGHRDSIAPHRPSTSNPQGRQSQERFRAAAIRYIVAICLILIGHLVIQLTWHHISSAPYTIYLAAVIVSAYYGGLGPGLLATALAAFDVDYAFTLPYGAFVADLTNLFYFSIFLTVALVVIFLQGRRRSAERLLRAEHEMLEQRVIERTTELARSREHFSLLVNGVYDQAFFMLDAFGRVASWNLGAERLLGYKQDQILGRPLTVIWPDGVETSATSWQAERYEYSDWIVRDDGARFWGCIFLTEVRDEAGRPKGCAIAVRDITDRKSLERDILDISEREQVRIGHDLHDGLGQELTGVALLTKALADRLRKDGGFGCDEANKIADLINDSIGHARVLARGLYPVDLEDEGLSSALRQITDQLARLPGFQCDFEAPKRLRIDTAIGSHLFRIAQEAINNAVRHGKCSHLTVQLIDEEGRLTLRVADNGIGIPDVHHGDGMGIRLMKYRAKMIGGTLHVRRGEQVGTAVTCTIAPGPKTESA